MPAVIFESSTPVHISFNLDTDVRFNSYPVVNLRESDPAPNTAQILPYGIAVWRSDRTRVVYPWHRITSLTEKF